MLDTGIGHGATVPLNDESIEPSPWLMVTGRASNSTTAALQHLGNALTAEFGMQAATSEGFRQRIREHLAELYLETRQALECPLSGWSIDEIAVVELLEFERDAVATRPEARGAATEIAPHDAMPPGVTGALVLDGGAPFSRMLHMALATFPTESPETPEYVTQQVARTVGPYLLAVMRRAVAEVIVVLGQADNLCSWPLFRAIRAFAPHARQWSEHEGARKSLAQVMTVFLFHGEYAVREAAYEALVQLTGRKRAFPGSMRMHLRANAVNLVIFAVAALVVAATTHTWGLPLMLFGSWAALDNAASFNPSARIDEVIGRLIFGSLAGAVLGGLAGWVFGGAYAGAVESARAAAISGAFVGVPALALLTRGRVFSM